MLIATLTAAMVARGATLPVAEKVKKSSAKK
jgi:hypothetical protein